MDAKACEDAMAAASIFECLEDIKHTRPLLHEYKFGFDQEHGIAFECECFHNTNQYTLEKHKNSNKDSASEASSSQVTRRSSDLSSSSFKRNNLNSV